MIPDPITTEIIRNAFLAATEDMRRTLTRSAYSPVIYEMKDCSVALFNERGQLLAQAPGLPFFLGALSEVVQVVVDHVGQDNFREGDVYVLNDPYLTGSHLGDVDVMSPVIYRATLVGFAITRAHWRDMGSKDAALSIDSTEIYQEGLRLGPVKIFDRGSPCEDVLSLLYYNSRMPVVLKGDMNAQIAACRIGERRYIEILNRFGQDVVAASMQSIFDTTTTLERAAIAAIPDGVYEAEGYQDSDSYSDEPFLVRVTVAVQGDSIRVDTGGSSLQRPGCTNCGLIQTYSAVRLAYKFLIRPDAEVTGGSFQTLSIDVEHGSIFAAQEPAACLQYGTHTMLLVDLIIQALAPAIPDKVAAGLPGDAWNIIMVHRASDGRILDTWGESTAGGWGASCYGDGASAVVHLGAGDFCNFPIESMENKCPVRIRQYALGTDSGGAGRYRGGLNVLREYQITADNVDVSLWFERTQTPQWGLFGGGTGAVPDVVVHPDTDCERHVLKVNHLPLEKGSVLRVSTGGGGGYGPAWERPINAVLEDVRDGYVSYCAAEEVYGVRFVDRIEPKVDVRATLNTRAAMRQQHL